jgi:putative phosphoribosyl transferase
MFENRFDAARQLVPKLIQYKSNPDAIVIAIPRGGLQLGSVLAHELKLPLDVIFTKKIGYPGNPEYAIGAASLSHALIAPDFANSPELQPYIQQQITQIRELLQRRSELYRAGKPSPDLANKTVIVVDDGVATGNTLIATLLLIKQENPQKIVVALPVGPIETIARLRQYADEISCLKTPVDFMSVGQFYEDFTQVDDQAAIRLLQEAQP